MEDNARSHIERIWSDYASGSARIKGALEGALLTVQKGFSREGHFIFEFIQNAEDARATTVKVILDSTRIEILNDGCPFTPADVDSLCTIGNSNKDSEGYIGYLGIGFKSVFLISDAPEVHSGDYHFTFRCPEGKAAAPWQVAPEWVPSRQMGPDWKCQFVIPLHSDETAQRLSEEMRKESLDSRVLLFLNSVKCLELVDNVAGVSRKIVQQPAVKGIHELVETSEKETVRERWTVFTSERLSVPQHVRDDHMTQVWNRDNATHRAVMLAFRLTDDGKLELTPGTIHMGIFSYLPLREEHTRLGFLVQADFLTTFGRTRIQDRAAWNVWLASEVLNLIKLTSQELLSHPLWRQNALEILWPGDASHNDFFANHVERPLAKFLQTDVALPAYDGGHVSPAEALYVSDTDMWEVVGPANLERLYALRPLASDIRVPLGLSRASAISETQSLFGNSKRSGFVSSSEGQALLKEKADRQDVSFFKLMYRKMAQPDWTRRTYLDSSLARAAIVLTSKGSVARPHEAHFKPTDFPQSMAHDFEFVHQELVSDEATITFLRLIGVKEPQENSVSRAMADRIIPDTARKWPHLSNEEKQMWLVKFKEMFTRNEVAPHLLRDFITLPTKSDGKWRPANELLFPAEFSPEPNIEPLVDYRLLDQPQLHFIAVDSVLGSDDLGAWRRFFQDLGVGSIAKDQNQLTRWVNRVSINAAKWYEEKHGRKRIREVAESERGVKDFGYDLRSSQEDGSDERVIEVKGTRGPGDFALRPTTLSAAFGEARDRFFIYVVTHALSNPKVNVIHATHLTSKVLLKSGSIHLDIHDVVISDTIDVSNLARWRDE